jgi:dihydroxyacetone kinase
MKYSEDLESVYKVASSVASNLATTAVSLDRCHVPGRKPDSKETAIGSRELEYGVGIHNEPGVLRAPLQSLPITICQLLKSLLDMEDTTRAFVDFRRGDDVALLINNLGGLSVLELHVILDEAVTQMGSVYGIHPKRIFLGTYVSSVNGSGFSLTLLKLEMWMLPLLDAATNAQSWTPNIRPDHNAQISLAELRPKTNKAELANLWGKYI